MDSLLPILMATALAFGAVFVLAEMSGVFSAKKPAVPAAMTPASTVPAPSPTPQADVFATPPKRATDLAPAPVAPKGASLDRAQNAAADASDDLAADYAVAAVTTPTPVDDSATVDFPLRVDAVGSFAGTDPTTAALERKARAAADHPALHRGNGSHARAAMPDPAAYATSIDQMGLTIGGSEPATSGSLLDAPASPAEPAPTTTAKTDSAASPDLFADPEGATTPPSRHQPPAHPKIFDASENTPMDPLRNKSFDLNSAKSVPSDLVR